MPLYLFYTMVQKSQKWPKTQIRGGGGGVLPLSLKKKKRLQGLMCWSGWSWLGNHGNVDPNLWQCLASEDWPVLGFAGGKGEW